MVLMFLCFCGVLVTRLRNSFEPEPLPPPPTKWHETIVSWYNISPHPLIDYMHEEFGVEGEDYKIEPSRGYYFIYTKIPITLEQKLEIVNLNADPSINPRLLRKKRAEANRSAASDVNEKDAMGTTKACEQDLPNTFPEKPKS